VSGGAKVGENWRFEIPVGTPGKSVNQQALAPPRVTLDLDGSVMG
jgi:hypothetical protein